MNQHQAEDEHLIAEDVDVEPVESNRRLFEGWRGIFIVSFATLYAAFHMAALNGLSLSAITGIDLPFLPQFPMETWNFRIVHVAGALALGFLMFSSYSFKEAPRDETRLLGRLSLVLLAPAVLSLGAAVYFGIQISGGMLWNGIDPAIRFNEIWIFGLPLLIATAGGIVLSWVHVRPRNRFAEPDVVLLVCAVAVATYLVTIYGTAIRMSTGSDFAPIG
ncbi:MAG: TRAP transporter permease, partial [Pseudomonadota bacterium]